MDPSSLFFLWCRGQLPNGEVTLRLFTSFNDPEIPLPTSFIEANFSGYRPAPDHVWVNRLADAVVAMAYSCLLTWVCRDDSPGQIVLGWYAVLTVEGTPYLIAFNRFDTPADLSKRGNSKSCFVGLQLFSVSAKPGV